MKHYFRFAAVLFLVATVCNSAPLNPQTVDASSKWVAHLDMEALRESSFGDFILQEAEKPEAKVKLDAFKAILAFDPIRDINSLTAYGTGSTAEEGAAIISGKFDSERALVLLRANDTYEKSDYGAYAIHKWTDEKGKPEEKTHWGCFYGQDTVVLANNKESVIQALDVLDGKKAGMTAKNSSFELLPSSRKMVLSATFGSIDGMSNIPAQANMFKTADGAGIGIWEENGNVMLEISVKTKTEELAASMHQVAQGWLAMAGMNNQQDPEITAMVQAAKVTVNGCLVKLNFRYSSASLIEIIKKNNAAKQQQQQPAGETAR